MPGRVEAWEVAWIPCLRRNDGEGACGGLGGGSVAWCAPRRDTRGERGYDESLKCGRGLLSEQLGNHGVHSRAVGLTAELRH